jgi:uncharacterized protein (TIGR02453 family)
MADDPAPFTGFTPAAIQFLADLAQNNDRDWFRPRKSEFERLVKGPMESLIAALAAALAERDVPLRADPARSPFRIYRDTRFSRDKSPYKTHLGASFPWVAGAGSAGDPAPAGDAAGRHLHTGAGGGYFNFEPGEMYAGGGMWMPDRPRIEAFRRVVRDDPARARAALEAPGFTAWFGAVHPHESLTRIPPGYPRDHPMADYFRWKDVVFGRRLSDAEVCSPGLPDLLADGYAAAVPVFRFLAALD